MGREGRGVVFPDVSGLELRHHHLRQAGRSQRLEVRGCEDVSLLDGSAVGQPDGVRHDGAEGVIERAGTKLHLSFCSGGLEDNPENWQGPIRWLRDSLDAYLYVEGRCWTAGSSRTLDTEDYHMHRRPRAGLSLVLGVLAGLVGTQLAGAQEKAMTDSTESAAVEAAKKAAESWLELVDAAEYGKSWAAAASMFKAAVTEGQWEAAVLQARGPFEPMGARQFLGAKYMTELPGAPKGQYVVIQYQVMAADNTKLVETITPMRDTDGTWRVSGYYIRAQ